MKLYPKIHIHVKGTASNEWFYACSTNWSKTCRDAKSNYLKHFPTLTADRIKANWAKD